MVPLHLSINCCVVLGNGGETTNNLIVLRASITEERAENGVGVICFDVFEVLKGTLDRNHLCASYYERTKTGDIPRKAVLLLRNVGQDEWVLVGRDASKSILADRGLAVSEITALVNRVLIAGQDARLPEDRAIARAREYLDNCTYPAQVKTSRYEFGWYVMFKEISTEGKGPPGGWLLIVVRDDERIVYMNRGM